MNNMNETDEFRGNLFDRIPDSRGLDFPFYPI